MPRNLIELERLKKLLLNLPEDIIQPLTDFKTEPLISYDFKGGKAVNEDGKFEADVINCVFHESVDSEKDVLEFNTEGSLIRIPAKNMVLTTSAIAVTLDFKFIDNNLDRINLFEGSSIPLVLMLVKKNEKYYPCASVNLSNGWYSCIAEGNQINPDEWCNLGAVFTGEEIFILKDSKCIARRIFQNSKLTSVGTQDFFIGTWVDGKRNQFKGMMSSFTFWDSIPGNFIQEISKAAKEGIGEIESKYQSIGGVSGFLGSKVGNEQNVVTGQNKIIGKYCEFANGTIYWSNTTGAHEVHGDILKRYKQISGPAGILGFPRSDEKDGKKPGSRLNIFENGAIYWSGATGAHEIINDIYAKYIILGAEKSFLGLPKTEEITYNNGTYMQFEGGRIYWSERTGAHEVHGAILEKYLSFDQNTRSYFGFPVSDELDILNSVGNPTGKKVSHFENCSIYWSFATGAYEVHGAILQRYTELGGASGKLGLPLTDESTAQDTNIRYNDFENGVILWTAEWGAREVTNLELRLGNVVSSQIDDGWNTNLTKDRSAELITYTTVIVNGNILDNGTRRPGGHAGDSFNINTNYPITNIRHDTQVYFKVIIHDWDKSSDNDYLGSVEMHFDISTIWGLENGSYGIYNEHPLTNKGGDAPNYNSVRVSFSIAIPSVIDPNKCFRDQFWWNFHNFSGPELSRNFYANTFKDVEIIGDNLWEEILNPMDTAIYEIAYKNICEKGNCFGMCLEALCAMKNNSLCTIPLSKYGALNDALRNMINRKHGYQIGGSAVSWAISKLLSSEAVSPLSTFSRVRERIDHGEYPIITMMSISKGSGHAVLAYKYSQTGQITKIFTADPNVPFPSIQGNDDPSYIEIDNAKNTFKFFSGLKDNNGNLKVSYETGEVLTGLMDDTYMMEIPYHVVSSMPSTPALYVLMGLFAILGGILLIAGDAECEQIASGSRSFFDYSGGEKRQKKVGVRGFTKIPIFDGPQNSFDFFALKGQVPNSFEVVLKGKKDGQYIKQLTTYNNMIKVESPIKLNEKDTVMLEGVNTSRPTLSLKTSENNKSVKISYATLNDIKGKDKILYNVNLQIADNESLVGVDTLGGSFIISQGGPPKQISIEKEYILNNKKVKSYLTLMPEKENQIIKITEFGAGNTQNEVLIEKIDFSTGKIVSRIKDIFK